MMGSGARIQKGLISACANELAFLPLLLSQLGDSREITKSALRIRFVCFVRSDRSIFRPVWTGIIAANW